MPTRCSRAIGRSLLTALLVLGTGVRPADAAVSPSYQLEPAPDIGATMTSPSFTLTVSDDFTEDTPLTSANYQIVPDASAQNSSASRPAPVTGTTGTAARAGGKRKTPKGGSQTLRAATSATTATKTPTAAPRPGRRTAPAEIGRETVPQRNRQSKGRPVPAPQHASILGDSNPSLLLSGAAGYAAAALGGPRAIVSTTAKTATWFIGALAGGAASDGARRRRKRRRVLRKSERRVRA